VTLASPAAARSGVIPLPAEVVSGPGSFSVDSTTRLSVPRGDRDADGAARYLVELWTQTNGLMLPISTGQLPIRSGAASIDAANTNTIAFRHQRGFGPEGYELEITPQRITVSASSAAGLFYGPVTLWQLPAAGGQHGSDPRTDHPRCADLRMARLDASTPRGIFSLPPSFGR